MRFRTAIAITWTLALCSCARDRESAAAAQIEIAPVLASPAPGAEERRAYVRAHYAKYEFRIPMRDGARLFTAVYVPNDASERLRYPMLVQRTPYTVAPYGAARYRGTLGGPAFEKAGYIFVYQDVRGRGMSEGEFVDLRPQLTGGVDDATDTYDTIAWLLAHVPHHNGKVGQWGVSYDGYYTTVGALARHPALVAVSPQAPVTDSWQGDDIFRNGAFNLHESLAFYYAFGLPRSAPGPFEGEAAWRRIPAGTPDQYRYFLELGPLSSIDAKVLGGDMPMWREIAAHPNYDAFWQARDLRPRIRDVGAAVLVVGGWYDNEDLFGALETYQAIERQSPRTRSTLIMGPWSHGAWHRRLTTDPRGDELGDTNFGFATAAVYQDLAIAFFEHHLRGGPAPALPEALMFETGANRWRRFDHWPPRAVRPERLYLRERGGLSFEAGAAGGAAFDEYVSDPARPVPDTLDRGVAGWSASFYAQDQRPLSRRPDVLTYETPPLERDVTFAGPLEVELFVATTGTDADWVVKLVDVEPGTLPGLDAKEAGAGRLEDGTRNRGGQETLVRGEPFRGRFRDGGDRPKPFTPGEVARVAFTVDDVLHTFQRGHRIQIQIQSSWFPFIDRNPQTYVPNIFTAKASDFVAATHRVYRAGPQRSSITVRVLPALDEPAR